MLSRLLSSVIKNKVNAANKVYKDVLIGSRAYIKNWLKLKTILEPEILNNLLTRLDKNLY